MLMYPAARMFGTIKACFFLENLKVARLYALVPRVYNTFRTMWVEAWP